MHEMTSRERVMLALNHREPDRVPLDIGAGMSTSLVEEAYENLANHLGVSHARELLSKTFRIARLDEAMMAHLGSDVRPVMLRAPRRWSPSPSEAGTFVDEFGIKWRQMPYAGGYYWEQATHPLRHATLADLEAYPWPDPDDPGRFEGLAEEVARLYYDTPYALMGDCSFRSYWEPACALVGMERALMALVAEPEFITALLGKLEAINAIITRRFLEIAGPYLAVMRTPDDLATQRGPMMSPATYRKIIKPFHRRHFALVKQYTDAKIFFHSCGNVVPLLDDLIDVGVEVLNPVQVSAFREPAGVKVQYGDRLSFWGGIDTQSVLPRGTPEDVRAEVRLRIRQFGGGGGYVAAAVHNIQSDVPPENILAMSRAVRELGAYPLS